MTLKSIEKYFARYTTPEVYPWVSEMLRDIQDEVDSGYMELPVDADGVPIHVGDVMEYENPNDDDKPFTVLGVNNEGDVFHCLEDKRLVPTCISVAYCLRHHKPRTVEDVLRDFINDAEWEQSPDSYEEIERRLITLCAAELRDLMGVDR